MKRILFFSLLHTYIIAVTAQDSTNNNTLSFSGYTEIYYQYDFNTPEDGNRPGFIYSHNRHNEFNLNLGYLKVAYATEKTRANLAFAAGSYMNTNYAAEPGVLKNIFEANAGIKISKKKNIWLDAGIMPSHIGFESALSKDCWTLTRSILADNSPYFEAGAKITYTTNNTKWLFSGMILNGWQRITRLDGNSQMSWGTQVQFKPSDKMLLNYSTFIGTDKPDSARLSRFFHNLYSTFNLSDKVGITLGFDIGTEEKKQVGGNNIWYASAAILKYSFTKKLAIAGRAEYYHDKNGVIINTGTANGFQTTGYSVNIDHAAFKNVLLQVEARRFNSKDYIFNKDGGLVKQNTFVTASIAVSF